MDTGDIWRALKSGKIVIYIQTVHVYIADSKPQEQEQPIDCSPATCDNVVCAFWRHCQKITSDLDPKSED